MDLLRATLLSASALLAACATGCGPYATPALGALPPAPAAIPQPASPEIPLGVNIDAINDYSPPLFVDAFKSCRTFGKFDQPWVQDPPIPTDAAGFPTQDFGTIVISNLPHSAGTYHFSCKGKVTIEWRLYPVSITNQKYDPATDTTTAEVTLAPGNDVMHLSFHVGPNGFRDWKLIRPGYPADTKQVFTNEFLAALKPFNTLRFMDLLNVNGNSSSKWQDRTLPDAPCQAVQKGAAYEYAILLCNQTHKNLWLNVPDQADDDYVKNLARLVKQQLDPGLVCYVEYSNELWNYGFPQAHRVFDQGNAEAARGSGILNADGTTDKYTIALNQAGRRSVEISNLFRSVFGDAAMNTTVRPVICNQFVNPDPIEREVKFIQTTYGTPSKFIYGIAAAPYLEMEGDNNQKPGVPVDQIIPLMDAQLKWIDTWQARWTTLARNNNLQLMAYEGGPGLQGDQNVDNKIAANGDPRMKPLVEKYLDGWYAHGGGLFMYYKLSCRWSKWGSWGAYQDFTVPTPKSEALIEESTKLQKTTPTP